MTNYNAHCREIAERIELYADGGCSCPECGAHLFNEYGIVSCPECGETIDTDECDPIGVYDWLNDALDIEYIIASDRRTLKGARILVAFGGPNIWVDTRAAEVTLRWWNESGRASISVDACAAVNDALEDIFYC